MYLTHLWAHDGSAEGANIDRTALLWTLLTFTDLRDLEQFIAALPVLLQLTLAPTSPTMRSRCAPLRPRHARGAPRASTPFHRPLGHDEQQQARKIYSHQKCV